MGLWSGIQDPEKNNSGSSTLVLTCSFHLLPRRFFYFESQPINEFLCIKKTKIGFPSFNEILPRRMWTGPSSRKQERNNLRNLFQCHTFTNHCRILCDIKPYKNLSNYKSYIYLNVYYTNLYYLMKIINFLVFQKHSMCCPHAVQLLEVVVVRREKLLGWS